MSLIPPSLLIQLYQHFAHTLIIDYIEGLQDAILKYQLLLVEELLPLNFDKCKLKVFSDDKINVPEKLKFALGPEENIVGKGENAGYQHFLLFPQCFQRPSFSRSLKVGIVWERVKSHLVTAGVAPVYALTFVALQHIMTTLRKKAF